MCIAYRGLHICPGGGGDIYCRIIHGVTAPTTFIFLSDIAIDFVSADGMNIQVNIERMSVLASMASVVAYVRTTCARRQTEQMRHLYFSVGKVFSHSCIYSFNENGHLIVEVSGLLVRIPIFLCIMCRMLY